MWKVEIKVKKIIKMAFSFFFYVKNQFLKNRFSNKLGTFSTVKKYIIYYLSIMKSIKTISWEMFSKIKIFNYFYLHFNFNNIFFIQNAEVLLNFHWILFCLIFSFIFSNLHECEFADIFNRIKSVK